MLRRAALYGVVVLFVLGAAAVAAHPVLLAALGRYLVAEDPLRPASAILVLGGGTPYREIEAAALYRAGWAPLVVMVEGGRTGPDQRRMEAMGITFPKGRDVRGRVLAYEGVPAEAVLVAEGEADATLDEIELGLRALPTGGPVIVVTSKFHTRRVRWYWPYVAGDRPAVVRAAAEDPFDPERWWRDQGTIWTVFRELLGLLNYQMGFPVARRAG